MDSILKNEIVNKYRSGVLIPTLAIEYGFTQKALERLLIPKPIVKVTTAIVQARPLTAEEAKFTARRKAALKAHETRRLNKMKEKAGTKEEAPVIPMYENPPVKLPAKQEEVLPVQEDVLTLWKGVCDNLYKIGQLILTKQ